MAVYTDVSTEELERFLARYDLGKLISAKGIAEGIENSNYFVMTEAGSFILTLYEKRVQACDLPYFLSLMEFLAARGIPCPTPIRDRSGQALRTLCDRPAALISFLTGVSASPVNTQHCAAVGRALAALHAAGQDFPGSRRNALDLMGWCELAEVCSKDADRFRPGVGSEIVNEIELLDRCWPGELPDGVIHGDLFNDNVFFDGTRLTGLIDFYFACNDLLTYDIAICLNAWCFDNNNHFVPERAAALVDAYRAVRPLDRAEYDALPLLARGAALRFLLTRLHDWLNPVDGSLVTTKDPAEYLTKLRFHRGISHTSAYGITWQ